MILLSAGWMRWLIFGLAACGGGALTWQEWLRPNRRYFVMRLIASNMAVSMLALLGLQPARRVASSQANAKIEAALWTATQPGTDDGNQINFPSIPKNYRFTLPNAITPAELTTTLIPDAAYLRRAFPEINVLHLYGDGLEADDLEALRGMHIIFHPTQKFSATPSVQFLYHRREIALGEPLIVQGSLIGLRPQDHCTLSLENPDGSYTQTTSFIHDGSFARFGLAAPAPAAVGQFLWRLRLKSEGENGKIFFDERIGVSVVRSPMLRILMLESSPHFETAQLQRWLSRLGNTWSARTLVGNNRYRFASSGDDTNQAFTSVDAAMLTKYDLVLADPTTLTTLSPGERTILRHAITENGLGLLVLGAGNSLPPKTGHDQVVYPAEPEFFLPWQFLPVDDGNSAVENTQERLVRLAWNGLAQPLENQIPAANSQISLTPMQRSLIRDSQGRNVAAAVQCGRGQIGTTLVRDTQRWKQENDLATYSAYWSLLLSQLAPPDHTHMGQWSISGGDSQPSVVNQPVHLQWVGAAEIVAPAKIKTDADDETSLPLLQDYADPHLWHSTFWPHHAGWHRVQMPPNGPAFNFFVHPTGSWASLRAGRMRDATARAAAFPAESTPSLKGMDLTASPLHPIWFFTLFCASIAFLWIERRFAV